MNEFEKNIMDGNALEYETEVDFVKNVNANIGNSVFPLFQRKIQYYEYDFLKTYLHALSIHTIIDRQITIKTFSALASVSNPVMVAPNVISSNERGLCLIQNPMVYVHLKYMGTDYLVTVYLKLFDRGEHDFIRAYFISVLGIQNGSFQPRELSTYLIQQAIKNSFYKNKILSINWNNNIEQNFQEIKICSIREFSKECFDEIFIPAFVKEELKRFSSCIENHKKLGVGIRYLLCGEPGTGKTKSIRTIVNNCYGKATIILAEGVVNFNKLFEFADLFSPVIICLDDLDLLIGSRENKFNPNSLGAFLQELDGFDKNNIFILATTNDKELIDKAASRPGRFDLLIDFGKLHKDNYRELINAKCTNHVILELFDDEMISALQQKKVTGAYIVNLLKQLEIYYKLNPDEDLRKYIRNFINLSYRGFYKKYEEKQMEFGFNNYDGNGIEVVDK